MFKVRPFSWMSFQHKMFRDSSVFFFTVALPPEKSKKAEIVPSFKLYSLLQNFYRQCVKQLN